MRSRSCGTAGLGLRFVTNTTSRSKGQTLDRLERLGFGVAPEELVTPAALARARCVEEGHDRVSLVMNEEVKADFEGLTEAEEDVDAVIMGDLGEAFGFEILNHAFRQVMDGAELIALQKNRFWMTPDGLALDAGPFVAAIEYATGREALVVGKPAESSSGSCSRISAPRRRRRRWWATTWKPTSAGPSMRGSPGSWCGRANTARTSSRSRASGRPRLQIRSRTCRGC